MLGVAYGAVLEGIQASVVRVEADVSQGLPQFSIVGLPDSAIQESKSRIRAAMKNSGLPFPNSRITINLSPASMRKRGPGLDLSIAMAILCAIGHVPLNASERVAFCGELSLAGEIVPVAGIVNRALALRAAAFHRVTVAVEQRRDLVDIPGLSWSSYATLTEVLDASANEWSNELPASTDKYASSSAEPSSDFADVLGLSAVKRALSIAATGRHHILLIGPPGSGKTMVAERFRSILPELSRDDQLEVFAIHQACGEERLLNAPPPLRNPHHSLTRTGLIGGGSPPFPGEATLAHRGVLLLDELLEFQAATLEGLREPLTTKTVRLNRGTHRAVFPTDFIMVGTLNPCRCGQFGFGTCTCRPGDVHRYWSALSGPFLDRIDMVFTVRPFAHSLHTQTTTVRSVQIRGQVESATRALTERLSVVSRRLGHGADLDSHAKRLLEQVSEQLSISRRGIESVIRVARSISAVDGKDKISVGHIQEALTYRLSERP